MKNGQTEQSGKKNLRPEILSQDDKNNIGINGDYCLTILWNYWFRTSLFQSMAQQIHVKGQIDNALSTEVHRIWVSTLQICHYNIEEVLGNT